MSSDEIKLDLERRGRIAIDEAIFCAGKTPAQLTEILAQAGAAGKPLLLTRLDAGLLQSLDDRHREAVDYEPLSGTGFFGRVDDLRDETQIAIVTAGTTDLPVSRESARTLAYFGHRSLEVCDVGVAGLWRLLERVDEIREMPVIIVAAGMDAALPSVVAGLVPGLVIALPTPVGYGVAAGGETALRAALASCAPGMVAVNIGNGYGAACAALRALHRFADNAPPSSAGGRYRDRARRPGDPHT